MAEPTFGTVIEGGKVKTRYGFVREVDYFERFKFWSANEFPNKLWLPRYSGHLILSGEIATVRVDRGHSDRILHSAIVGIDEALQPLARSERVDDRMHVGAVMVRSVIISHLAGSLANSPEAVEVFANMSTNGQLESLRQQAVSAH